MVKAVIVYSVTDMMEVTNMVVTGNGDGRDLLEKKKVDVKFVCMCACMHVLTRACVCVCNVNRGCAR